MGLRHLSYARHSQQGAAHPKQGGAYSATIADGRYKLVRVLTRLSWAAHLAACIWLGLAQVEHEQNSQHMLVSYEPISLQPLDAAPLQLP